MDIKPKTSAWGLEDLDIRQTGRDSDPDCWIITAGGAQQPRYAIKTGDIEEAVHELVRQVTEDAIADEARAWRDSGTTEKMLAACEDCAKAREENADCKAALQNLSACCYGQTLTQSVLGAVALIEAYRTSEIKLRKKMEALEKCLAENSENEMFREERDEARGIAKDACSMLAENNFEVNYPPMPWEDISPENSQAIPPEGSGLATCSAS